MNLKFSAIHYRAVRDRVRAMDTQIDEETLADTVEGLTNLHEIVQAIIRSALVDQALASGLKCRITVPLCRDHHQQLHQAGNEVGWWHDLGIKPLAIAKDLWSESKTKAPSTTRGQLTP